VTYVARDCPPMEAQMASILHGHKKPGMNCTSACITKSHYTFGECMRSKNLQVAPIANLVASKAWDKELDEYRAAKAQGINPSSTRTKNIRDAVEISQRTGKAFDSENVIGSLT